MGKWVLPVLALMLGFTLAFFIARDKGRSEGRAEGINASSEFANRIGQLQSQVRATQTELQATTQARESCEAKFQRATILYDGILFQSRQRVIPADVEPIYLGKDGQATYTHVDPKTQMETMHMKPKPQ
jgi:uncharacterized small protein (DUF1192 family)